MTDQDARLEAEIRAIANAISIALFGSAPIPSDSPHRKEKDHKIRVAIGVVLSRRRAAPNASDREMAMALITKLQRHPCAPTDDDIGPTAETLAEVRRATMEQCAQWHESQAAQYDAVVDDSAALVRWHEECATSLRALSPTAKEPV